MPLEVEVEAVDYRYLLRLYFPLLTADVELESIPVAVEVEVAVVEVEVAVVELMVVHGERFGLRSGYLRVCGKLFLCDFHLGTLA